MATEVLLVKAGMTMTEGSVAEWYVPDGGTVERGQLLYRMETEKIELEVEAEASGIVRHVAPGGTSLVPGALIAYILAPGEAPPPGLSPGLPVVASNVGGSEADRTGRVPDGEQVPSSPIARRLAAEAGVPLSSIAGTGPGGRVTEGDVRAFLATRMAPKAASAAARSEVAASPLARRMAEQRGIDLRLVTGTGPNGRITREDVEGFTGMGPPRNEPAVSTLPAPGDAPGAQLIPIRAIRKVIAERMHASLRDMAQLTMSMEVVMDEAVKLRAALVAEWEPEGIRPSYTDLVIKAVARALVRHPRLNATMHDAEIELHGQINVGMAVAVDDGLLVPVIRDADRVALKELSVTSSRLAEAARNGTLGLDDMVGGTFSVTALGMAGIDFFTPVINPPNVAILGVGRIRDGVAWEGDRPVRQQQMTVSLTIDHRAVDGAPGAAFLNTVRELLESPYRLLV